MGRDREEREQQLGELVYGYEKPQSSKNGSGGGAGGGRARSGSDASSDKSVGSNEPIEAST